MLTTVGVDLKNLISFSSQLNVLVFFSLGMIAFVVKKFLQFMKG